MANPAADNVTQNIIEHEIEVRGVGAVFFQEVDGGDDTAAGTADTRLRPAGLDTFDVAVADLHDIFQLQILDGAALAHQVHNRILRLSVQNQTG